MSARAELGHRGGGRARLLVAVAVLISVGAVAVVVGLTAFSGGGSDSRPDLQRIIDPLVQGRGRVAPGVTAFVTGPHGTWSGAAGLANVKTGEKMWPDAPMHLDSQTKTWVATVILGLVAERRMRLDDTVARWLPGALLYGGRITVRELLGHTSGMVDQDTFDDPLPFVRKINDPALRNEMLRVLQRINRDPTYHPRLGLAAKFIRTLPLLWPPGSGFHYSNIGYEVAGMVAARVGGASLGTLLRQRISKPLGLTSAVYAPGGETRAHHPQDYKVQSDGTVSDATDWYRADEGASGAMIANARDQAGFLTALMQGELLPSAELTAMKTPSLANSRYGLGTGIMASGCHGLAYDHGGASYSTTGVSIVSADGKRVAVILLNGNTADGHLLGVRSSTAAFAAAKKLFCAA